MFSLARLLPREDKFHRYLKALSHEALVAARHLQAIVSTEDAGRRREAAAAIMACKTQAKKLSSEITQALCLTFITPFDREDIQLIASELYRIPKNIDKVREYLELHRMTQTQELSAQANLIVQEALAMENMLATLLAGGKTQDILQQAGQLDALENEGDEILSALLVKLLENTSDARELILRKDIYDLLERIIDRYRDAAKVALQIALKHS